MKTGLVLEGGALRTIFSSGVCDAFLNEKLPMPDYTIGVSAGIAYGIPLLLFCPMSLRKDGYDFPQHSADNRKFSAERRW